MVGRRQLKGRPHGQAGTGQILRFHLRHRLLRQRVRPPRHHLAVNRLRTHCRDRDRRQRDQHRFAQQKLKKYRQRGLVVILVVQILHHRLAREKFTFEKLNRVHAGWMWESDIQPQKNTKSTKRSEDNHRQSANIPLAEPRNREGSTAGEHTRPACGGRRPADRMDFRTIFLRDAENHTRLACAPRKSTPRFSQHRERTSHPSRIIPFAGLTSCIRHGDRSKTKSRYPHP